MTTPPRQQLQARRRYVGLSQEALAERLEVDRSTIGRWEAGITNPRPRHRARLAEALEVSLDDFDDLLNESDQDDHEVSDNDDQDDDVNRRQFLASAGSAFAALLLDPARLVGTSSVDPTGPPLSTMQLTTAVDELKRTYQACRYDLAMDLTPPLLHQLAAAEDLAVDHDRATLARLSAHTYHVAASLLIKLQSPEAAADVADQAMTHALASDDPVAIAAAARIVTHSLMTIGDDHRATTYAADHAARLDDAIRAHTTDSISIYGALLLRGAVAAGQANDPESARSLLDEAERAALELGGEGNYQWTGFGPNNVLAHRVSVELALGNAGTAVQQFNRIDIAQMPIIERKAVTHLDLANAYTQWAKYDDAIDALREAQAWAPQEIRRPRIQQMIHHIDQLANPRIRAQLTGFRVGRAA